MIEINVQIGNNLNVKVTEQTRADAIENAGFFAEVAAKCVGRNVQFYYRNPKGYNFYGVHDLDTGDRLPFGQLKEGGGFFVKEWERPPAPHGEAPQDDPPSEPDDVPMQYGPSRAQAAPGASAGRPPQTYPAQRRKY